MEINLTIAWFCLPKKLKLKTFFLYDIIEDNGVTKHYCNNLTLIGLKIFYSGRSSINFVLYILIYFDLKVQALEHD